MNKKPIETRECRWCGRKFLNSEPKVVYSGKKVHLPGCYLKLKEFQDNKIKQEALRRKHHD